MLLEASAGLSRHFNQTGFKLLAFAAGKQIRLAVWVREANLSIWGVARLPTLANMRNGGGDDMLQQR
ncbi:hypothetical protein CN085_10235 [Sinorhizobium meliloti]|nr:hypothetical protein CN217_15865 [Sinorhizobium meliloti]RVP15487.1 hypothetical protein CN085_10235 [Sinorhizobium meliloti]